MSSVWLISEQEMKFIDFVIRLAGRRNSRAPKIRFSFRLKSFGTQIPVACAV
jgi:hypothetical protein